MTFIADLHIHSRFSRATSRALDTRLLALWAARKGIAVVGTGDITHPTWLAELKENLVDAEEGLFRLRPGLEKEVLELLPPTCRRPPRFMLSGEISCIYKKGGRTRKLHHLVLLPDFDAAASLGERLDRIGNITSDGRPILGLDSRDLLEIVLETDDRGFFIPAHIWTPWFSLFGSKSGFDSLEECFEDLSNHIHALETGLSSDPPMNRRLSALDRCILVSNSDAHSAGKLGREANIFDTELGYSPMIRAMADGTGFVGTIEFYPEEGKYHLDGHRKCKVCMDPRETREARGLCPVCGAPVTVGVLNRVDELADRDEPALQRPFHSLIPLNEVLGELFACGPGTKKVAAAYDALLADLGPELDILMKVSHQRIEASGGPLLARAVLRMRDNRVIRSGGYDGEYGVIKVFEPLEIAELAGQAGLFESSRKARPAPSAPARPRKKSRVDQRASKREDKGDTKNSFDPILDPLNPGQKEAVLYGRGHLLITAGPGTGKTLTLTHRIAHMIREGGVGPENVLALTFTNKAAGEMRERLGRLLGSDYSKRPLRVSTFHRFCLDTLRENGSLIGIHRDFRVCSEMDTEGLALMAAEEACTRKGRARSFLSRLPRLKRMKILGLPPEPEDLELESCFTVYQGILRSLGMLDLDDLQVETSRLFRDHPETCRYLGARFPRVFVDEYQDTDAVQASLLQRLALDGGCIVTAIGDPHQAIYGFRGAEVIHFLAFSREFPGAAEISLTRNYRSTRNILEGAAALLGKDAPLAGGIGEGVPIRMGPCRTHREEAEMVVEQIEKLLGGTSSFSMDSGRVSSRQEPSKFGFADMAVLFRLNAQAEAFEEAFIRAGIPFARSGEKPLSARKPVNLLYRYLLALSNPHNRFYKDTYFLLLEGGAERGESNLAACGIRARLPDLVDTAASLHGLEGHGGDAPESLRRLRALASAFEGDLPSFLDTLALDRGIDHQTLEGDRVALMSFHAAKGLEWPVVFLAGIEDGITPLELFRDTDEEEELRLLYVALTRTGRRSFISWASRRSLNGRTLELSPSRFLKRLPDHVHAPIDRSAWKPRRRHKQLRLF
ncbi:MAG: UvrD-helicase domain-containing protein [Thermodesulfobacteriota bacterium]